MANRLDELLVSQCCLRIVRRPKTAYNIVGAVGLIGVGLLAYQFFTHDAIILNDTGTGPILAGRSSIRSTYKEGFLVMDEKEVVRTPLLQEKPFYRFRLYEKASTRSPYFEIWSESDQPRISSANGSFKSKVRIELESRKIGALMGDVWFIRDRAQ